MQQLVNVVLGCVVFLVSAGTALAQIPRGTAKLSLIGKEISVEYGRPSLKGRTVQQLLDQLKPGDVWRLGADKSTAFSTTTDLNFMTASQGSFAVPKGEYSLWARKEADGGWKLVFNKQHGQWGTQHDPARDLVAVPLNQTKAAKAAEMVTIRLADAEGRGVLSIRWGDMILSTKMTATPRPNDFAETPASFQS